MSVYSYNSVQPIIDPSAYVHDGATIIGNCAIGELSSVWPGAVIRADNDLVKLGNSVNVQDNAVIHVDTGHPAILHDGVSIAHGAIIHGATIGENTLIGMNAVVLNNAVIGKNCIIGANALVAAGKVIPDNSLVIGSPGRVLRQVTDDEIESNKINANSYALRSGTYKQSLRKLN